jgi:LPPG:FO 2-phospho-L-lactate transferase
VALKIVCIVGGVGGAKLAHGLAQILEPGQLTVIVNTGDDFWHYGLRICPDLDTVMYTLSGLVDPVNGWGIAADTDNMLSALRRYGEATWFGLKDQDVATHLLRTQWLNTGQRLTEVVQELTRRLGISHTILPMTDAPAATMVDTVEQGELAFQEYFVRERWQPTVKALRVAGIENASMSAEVQSALAEADVILFGPSNPWLSIMPILSVPGFRSALISRPIPRVALTPIIQGEAVKGPASKLMAELGYKQSAESIVTYYEDVLTGFVYDMRDADLRINRVRAVALDTLMQSTSDRARLAREILDWIATWHEYAWLLPSR